MPHPSKSNNTIDIATLNAGQTFTSMRHLLCTLAALASIGIASAQTTNHSPSIQNGTGWFSYAEGGIDIGVRLPIHKVEVLRSEYESGADVIGNGFYLSVTKDSSDPQQLRQRAQSALRVAQKVSTNLSESFVGETTIDELPAVLYRYHMQGVKLDKKIQGVYTAIGSNVWSIRLIADSSVSTGPLLDILTVSDPTRFPKPKNGYIPTKECAIQVAEAIIRARGIAFEDQLPLVATLSNKVWIVRGTLPKNTLGVVLHVEIAQDSGAILECFVEQYRK